MAAAPEFETLVIVTIDGAGMWAMPREAALEFAALFTRRDIRQTTTDWGDTAVPWKFHRASRTAPQVTLSPLTEAQTAALHMKPTDA